MLQSTPEVGLENVVTDTEMNKTVNHESFESGRSGTHTQKKLF